MEYQLSWKPYKRPFASMLMDPKGAWRDREGVLIHLKALDGSSAYGEIAPLPHFPSETLSEAIAWLDSCGHKLTLDALQNIPVGYNCTHFALTSAIQSMRDIHTGHRSADCAALLYSDFRTLKTINALTESGYRRFKLKVGREPVKEQTLFRQLTDALPEGSKIRLDANAQLDERSVRSWLKLASESANVEFFEQPLPAGKEKEMRILASEYGVSIALDESVTGLESLKRIHDMGWKGPFVIKPALIGPLDAFMTWREHYKPTLVYSSAFETAIGYHAFLFTALSDPSPEIAALGAGTLDYFPNDGLQLYNSSSKMSLWNFTSDDFEKVWDQAST